MGEITLKTIKRATTVKRSVVRKAVEEAFQINNAPRIGNKKTAAKKTAAKRA